jgi:orotate phosphoribosyltransferase
VVDDVLTTGGSVRDVLDAVRGAGGEVAGVAVLIDRTGGKAEFGVPFFACLSLDLESYERDDCLLCADGVPLKLT